MNPTQILELVAQGLALLPALIDAGIAIDQRIEQLIKLAKQGAAGTITDDELAKIRAQFDADLDSFNTPIA